MAKPHASTELWKIVAPKRLLHRRKQHSFRHWLHVGLPAKLHHAGLHQVKRIDW
jgi:hypothetical protein